MVLDRSKRVEGLFKRASEAADVIRKHVEKGDFIRVISHLDSDGLSAAGVMCQTLTRLNAYFSIRIAMQIDESLLEGLASESPSLLIFTDFGSGYLDLIRERLSNSHVVVLDHHQPLEVFPPNVTHVNPHLHGFDGSREISGSGVTYLVAKALDGGNVDLACVSVVGALGDLQDKNKKRTLFGLNEIIVKDAVDAGFLKTETDLIFYGRETRPIHKALAYTTNPFIPGLSGEEDKCLGFLVNLGIDLKHQDRWRTLADLTVKEKQKLFSELARFLVSRDLPSDTPLGLIGTVYTLIREDHWTPLRDAREYASLLNACGRMGKGGLGVTICVGDRGKALEEAHEILNDYRKTLAQYVGWISETPGSIQELKGVYVVRGEGVIDEKMLGAVTSILTTTGLFKPEKPIISTTSTADGLMKVSARGTDLLIGRGLNLGTLLQKASEEVLGRGGGHDVAAGAQIPENRVEDFIKLVDRLVSEQVSGRESRGS